MPALLTKSSLCVLKGAESIRASAQEDVARMSLPPSELRVVLPIEHFAILSFPLSFPGCDERWAKYFPWDRDVDWLHNNLTTNMMRQMTGNGMNLHAIGAVMAVVLGGCVPQSVRQPPRGTASQSTRIIDLD